MANLKSLAKDTAIYGMSSIIGRFLNYLLVPLYTAKISAASGGYGVILLTEWRPPSSVTPIRVTRIQSVSIQRH